MAFIGWEQVAELSDEVPEGLIGSGSALSDQGFRLGECHLAWVEVRGAGWQEGDPVALCLEDFLDAGRFVGRQLVGDDDLTGPEGWGETRAWMVGAGLWAKGLATMSADGRTAPCAPNTS